MRHAAACCLNSAHIVRSAIAEVLCVELMLEHTARWVSAAARLLLLLSGAEITVTTHEPSACRATVHSGFLAWKSKQLAGSSSVCSHELLTLSYNLQHLHFL